MFAWIECFECIESVNLDYHVPDPVCLESTPRLPVNRNC